MVRRSTADTGADASSGFPWLCRQCIAGGGRGIFGSGRRQENRWRSVRGREGRCLVSLCRRETDAGAVAQGRLAGNVGI